MLSIQLSIALVSLSGSSILCTVCKRSMLLLLQWLHIYIYIYTYATVPYHGFDCCLFSECPQLEVQYCGVGLLGSRFVHHHQTCRLRLTVRPGHLHTVEGQILGGAVRQWITDEVLHTCTVNLLWIMCEYGGPSLVHMHSQSSMDNVCVRWLEH